MHNVILIWIVVLFAFNIHTVFVLCCCCFFFPQVHYLLFCLPLPVSTSIFIRCIESFWCFIVIEATERRLFGYVHAYVLCFKGTLVKSDERMLFCLISSVFHVFPLLFSDIFSHLLLTLCQSIHLSFLSQFLASIDTSLLSHSVLISLLFFSWLCYCNISFLWHFLPCHWTNKFLSCKPYFFNFLQCSWNFLFFTVFIILC